MKSLRLSRRESASSGVAGLLLGCGLALLFAWPVAAQISLGSTQRSADGTTYEVIIVPNGSLFGGAEEFRLTAVAGSPIGLQPCSSIGSGVGGLASAMVGGDQSLNPPQTLHPFGNTLRTAILTPNSTVVSFEGMTTSGGGRLRIGTGAGAIEVCRNSIDCAGGATDAPLVPLTSSTGGVPSACIANGVTAYCSSSSRSAIGFGLPATGNVCNSPPTTKSTVCGSRPTDGVTLKKGQVLVIVYHSGISSTGFTVGASGFGIDTDGTNAPACSSANRVVSADAQGPSAPAPPARVPPVGAPAASEPMLGALALALAGWGFLRLRPALSRSRR